MSTDDVRALFVELAQHQLGRPYIWGGSGVRGHDCSGLVVWTMQQLARSWPDHYISDTTAAGLYDHFDGLGCPDITEVDDLRSGCLVFYRNAAGHIVHVVIHCYTAPDTGPVAIEAGGGGSTTTTARAALLRAAGVRFAATDRGKRWVGKDPFGETREGESVNDAEARTDSDSDE